MATKDERAERLAAALRENLRKRKAQAKGEGDAPPENERSDELSAESRKSRA